MFLYRSPSHLFVPILTLLLFMMYHPVPTILILQAVEVAVEVAVEAAVEAAVEVAAEVVVEVVIGMVTALIGGARTVVPTSRNKEVVLEKMVIMAAITTIPPTTTLVSAKE